MQDNEHEMVAIGIQKGKMNQPAEGPSTLPASTSSGPITLPPWSTIFMGAAPTLTWMEHGVRCLARVCSSEG